MLTRHAMPKAPEMQAERETHRHQPRRRGDKALVASKAGFGWAGQAARTRCLCYDGRERSPWTKLTVDLRTPPRIGRHSLPSSSKAREGKEASEGKPFANCRTRCRSRGASILGHQRRQSGRSSASWAPDACAVEEPAGPAQSLSRPALSCSHATSSSTPCWRSMAARSIERGEG